MSKSPPPIPRSAQTADPDSYRRTKAKAASLLFPGLGQFVLQRRVLGTVLFVLGLLVLAIIVIMLVNWLRFLLPALEEGLTCTFSESFTPVLKFIAGIPALLALYIWGFVDVLQTPK